MPQGRGVLIGTAAAGGVVWLRQSGLFLGWSAAAVAALAILALPTSRSLSRRVLLASMLLFGWLPVLWWWRLPVGQVGRVTVLLALLLGGLAGWFGSGTPVSRLRQMRPDLRIVDAYPLVTAVSGFWLLRDWLSVRDPRAALSILLSGWDNVSHFDMFFMIRRLGATLNAVGPAPDGSAWYLSNYPQAFHAFAAAAAELGSGVHAASAQTEMVGYVHVQAVIFIAVATMIVAGLCSLPHVRRRPAVAVAASSAVGTAYLIGPGAAFLVNGQLSFVLATALCGAIALVSITAARPTASIPLAAACGALVAVANGWTLLLVLALPAAGLMLLPLRRLRWQSTREQRVAAALMVLIALFGCFHALAVLTSLGSPAKLLSVYGYTPQPPLWRALLVCALAALVALVGSRNLALGNVWRTGPARIAALAAVPLAGLAVAGAIALIEIRTVHHTSYYFWKFLSGVELVSFVVLAAGLGSMPPLRVVRLSQSSKALSLVVTAAAATQLFGYLGPPFGSMANTQGRAKSFANLRPSPMQLERVYSAAVVEAPYPVADQLFSAIRLQSARPDRVAVFLALTVTPEVPWNSLLIAAYYRALTATWTSRVHNFDFMPPPLPIQGIHEAKIVAAHILDHHSDAIIVVSPNLVDQLRAAVGNPALSARIISW
jgi:hypothetical protein